MRKRRNWSKRLLAGVLSAAMVALNISTATPAFAAPSAEEYREDAELINDLALPKDVQRQLAQKGSASPSDAAAKEKKAEDLTAGSARWGTPSNAAKVLHTQLDGVEIEVSAPAGVLPEGATLKARKLSEEEEKEVLEKINEHAEAAGKTATTQFLCDLTVLNASGEPIQPDNAKGTLAVSFRNIAIVSAESSKMGEDSEAQEQSGVSVLHIDEAEEKVDTLREGLDENLPVLQAAAEHFSPFAVVNYTPTSPTPLPLSVAFKRLDYDDDNRLAYKLKDVTVTDTPGTGITSMNFQVDVGSIELLGTPTGVQTFTDILSAHKFYQIIFPTALSAADAQTFIENNLKFHLPSAGATQQVKITLGNGANNLPSGATITKATIPNPRTDKGDTAEHYYMYVEPNPGHLVSWADSYNLAKSYRLNGMVGYLVTITSATEDTVLDNITTVGAWSGGNRWTSIGDAASIPAWPDNSAALRAAGQPYEAQSYIGHAAGTPAAFKKFRWQDGPEAGVEYYEQGGGPLNGMYTNFTPGEPNSSPGDAGAAVNGYESVMQVHAVGGKWNDLHNLTGYNYSPFDIHGFFVEFSAYKQSGTTVNQSIPLVTSDVAYVVVNGQRQYFSNLDDAIAWSNQNGNPPITLTNNTVVTQNIPAGVVINTGAHTLGVPAGKSVTNNGTINVGTGGSFVAQGTNGGFTNAGSGAVNVPLTIKVNPRNVTATEPLTWSPSDVTVTGLIGNDRVTGVTVNFDNSQPVATTTTDNATPLAPTTLDNGTAGSTAIGTYTITYVPGLVTRNPHHYTVKFVANAPAGQTATGSMPDQTITGSTGTANLTNHFAVNGYTFNGWTGSNGQTYADGATPANLVTTNNGVITMTANWTENQYDIHYHENIPAGSRTAATAVNPNTIAHYKVTDPNVTLAPMTMTGYTFDGWYDNSSLSGSPVSQLVTGAAPAGNRDYYAKWTRKNYTLSYDLHDSTPAGHPASNPDSGFTTYTVETPNHTFGTPTRPGYTFLGWYTDAGYTTPAPATLDTTQGDTNPTQLHAKWSAPLPYTITYVMNDATPAGHPATNDAANPGGFQVTEPVITLQDPTRTGYDFQGWYADPGFTTRVTTINPASATDHTVYAKWSAANTYTVQWTLNDGTPAGHPAANPNTISSYTVEDADVAIAPATRTGYNFLGWYDNPGFTGAPVTNLHTMDAADKHYYAKWDSTPISYPVNYVLNDTPTTLATNPAVNLTSYTVETLPSSIAVAQPLRPGSPFLGCYDNAAAPAAPPAAHPNTASRYTSLHSDIAFAPATSTGYDFEGWYDNAGLTGTPVTTLHTADAAAKDYYAKWSAAKTYTVQWELNDGNPAGQAASNPNTVTS